MVGSDSGWRPSYYNVEMSIENNKAAYPNLPNDGGFVSAGTGEEQAIMAPRYVPDFVGMDGQDRGCHSWERRLVALVVCV